MIRVVLDLNVILSAVIVARGFPFMVWSAWLADRFSVVISEPMLEELAEKLQRSRIARSYGVTPQLAALTLALLRARALLVPFPDTELRVVTGDPEDDAVLATGRLAAAHYLVTGDKRLQAVRQYGQMEIVDPHTFARLLRLSVAD